LFIPEFRHIVQAPPPSSFKSKVFLSNVSDLLINPLKSLGHLSDEKLRIVFDFLQLFVRLFPCATKFQGVHDCFSVLDAIFDSPASPFFASNPTLPPELHRTSPTTPASGRR
jgi:hypothetical protein